MLEHVLAFFAFIMVSLASVYADEGYIPYWPDFLEPDGITLRSAEYYLETEFAIPNEKGGHDSDPYSLNIFAKYDSTFDHLKPKNALPLKLHFPQNIILVGFLVVLILI